MILCLMPLGFGHKRAVPDTQSGAGPGRFLMLPIVDRDSRERLAIAIEQHIVAATDAGAENHGEQSAALADNFW